MARTAVRAWLSIAVPALLAARAEDVAASLAAQQMARRLSGEPQQLRAWERQVALLQAALAAPDWQGAHLALEFDMLRLERRIDAVLLSDRAIFVLEFKVGATAASAADRAQAEDYAQDLLDFHAASRAHPILPVVVATEGTPGSLQLPLPTGFGVRPTSEANAATLGERLLALLRALPEPAAPLSPAAWLNAPYQPVPTIVEAAARLFSRNSVADIAAARADTDNLTRTTEAILRALDRAAALGKRAAVFVTGVPGAGKTLCGLNVVFGDRRREGTAFLTGNAPLVAVLREALACDRAGIDLALGPSNDPTRRARLGRLRQARQETSQALQNVHRFLADNAAGERPPHERVIVFDEAQRAWDAKQATRDTLRRKSDLTQSEPAHALDIMGRHAGFSAIVALVGPGQEINTGEAGLREWGRVLADAPGWLAFAAGGALAAPNPAQRLADGPAPWIERDDALHLAVPIRGVRGGMRGAAWVDAVLRGDAREAAAIAAGGELPYLLTRSLDAARGLLRALTPGLRRAGFVRSSGARRLRAEGFDAQLVGAEEPVAWFLERWPDVRASDALEVAATEYACQGLELDAVGLAWGGDLVRGASGWRCREWGGRAWRGVHQPAAREFVVNTHRVLLTRARYETVIWVPRGSSPGPWHDATRDAAEMDAVADFLLACGARPADAAEPHAAAPALPTLL